MLFVSFLAGLIIGGGCCGWWLTQRWQRQVQHAEKALSEIAAQHKTAVEESKAMKQQVADLTWQLNDSRKTVRYLESRYQAPKSDE